MAAFEVLSLDTATPQIRAPGAGDTYTFPRQAMFLAGTVGAPGVAQTSDDNTGMWWPAADTLAWSVNGLEGMRLSTTGLGIGVTPGAVLHVGAANTVSPFFVQNITAGGGGFRIAWNADSAWARIFNSGGTETIRLASNGDSWMSAGGLAIGTATIVDRLTVETTARNIARFTSTSSGGPIIDVYRSANRVFNIECSSADNVALRAIQSGKKLSLVTNGGSGETERAFVPGAGGMVVGIAALATNATDGFLYVPTCAGTPTGTPTTQTGTAPIVVDTTNNKLYFYSGGAWRDAGP